MEIDYGTYAFKMVSYYFWYLCDLFVGFPLVIQVCILIIMLSVCVGIYLLCQTVYLYVIKHKEKKIMDKFIELYRDPMIEIGNDDVVHEPDEIAEMMNYDRRKPFSVREKRLLVQNHRHSHRCRRNHQPHQFPQYNNGLRVAKFLCKRIAIFPYQV